MRLLLDSKSRKIIFQHLREKYEVNSLIDLSKKMNISFRTLQNWLYVKERLIPEKFIPSEIRNKIIVLREESDNWGRIKGGKKTYRIIIEKYGKREIENRQINGGKSSRLSRLKVEKSLELDLLNPIFLEFYGVLLGDGWLSSLNYRNKTIWLIGISGNGSLDREFFSYLKKNIQKLFGRNPYQKERPKYNSIELNFTHKALVKELNKKLQFPIGKKLNLRMHENIYSQGYEKTRNVIRGIFDTDGSFYFDKTPSNRPYPCISIKMKAPILMGQIRDILLGQGFRLTYRDYENGQAQIKLKGSKQLSKWMREIGSSNPKHLNKIALVAQLDSAAAS